MTDQVSQFITNKLVDKFIKILELVIYLAINAAIMYTFASRTHKIGFFSAIFAQHINR